MRPIREADPSPRALDAIDRALTTLRADTTHGFQEWLSRYARNHRRRLAVDLDMVAATCPQSTRLLEIGSVPPILTLGLREYGYQVTGVDIAPERFAAAFAAAQVAILKCDIEREALPLADASFDCVLINEVFEHLRIDPVFTFRELARVARPGATLLLSTPNLRSIKGIVNFLCHDRAFSCSGDMFRQYSKLATHGHMGHVREYTATEVREFLAHVGIDVTAVTYRGTYRKPAYRAVAAVFPAMKPFMSLRARIAAR